jgi:hypothetical protein
MSKQGTSSRSFELVFAGRRWGEFFIEVGRESGPTAALCPTTRLSIAAVETWSMSVRSAAHLALRMYKPAVLVKLFLKRFLMCGALIIFRQQFTQMTDIVDKTHKLYKAMGANYVGPPSWTWTFPSGAKVRLAYISADKDIWEYLGPRYSFIGFDESTFHSEYQVRNMLGRLSSTDKTLNLRMRLCQ